MESVFSIVMALALAISGSGDSQAAAETTLEDVASGFISEYFSIEDLQIEGLGDISIDVEQIEDLVTNITSADVGGLSDYYGGMFDEYSSKVSDGFTEILDDLMTDGDVDSFFDDASGFAGDIGKEIYDYALSGVENEFGIERETTEAVLGGVLRAIFGG